MLEMQMFHAGSSFQLRVVLYPAYRDCHAGDGGVRGISPGGGTHGVLRGLANHSHDRAPGVEGAKGALPRTGIWGLKWCEHQEWHTTIFPLAPSGADLLFIEH